MIVEIIKRHPVGIEVGVIKDIKTHIAYNLIEEGYAVESTREKHDEYKQKLKDEKAIESAKIRASIVEKISAEKAAKIANQEKKNSDADAKHAVSDIEAVKAEYFDLGVQQGTKVGFAKGYRQGSSEGNADASYSEGLQNGTEAGYEQGHAEGYKLGYDACLAEMANNIFPEPEAEPDITGSQAEIEPVITINEPDAPDAPDAPDRPKRGRPATK